MAEKSGFFNAIKVNGVYDRKYSANDYTDNLAFVISSGVLRSVNDDLKVTASGMVATVGVGRGWIDGHYYINTLPIEYPSIPIPTSGSRIDRVVLRLNNTLQARKISVEYVEGTAASDPQKPDLIRTDVIYDLCLAEIRINAGDNNLYITDTRGDADLCGWVYSTSGDNSFFTSLDGKFDDFMDEEAENFNDWFTEKKDTLASVTIFKRYKWETTLNAPTNEVSFEIPQYDANTCFIEVFVNGLFDDNYSLSGNTITFNNTLTSGTEITVCAYKSVDGTGIESVGDEITALQNAVAALDDGSRFTYRLTGTDDNISLSQIAQALLNGEYTPSELTQAAQDFLAGLGANFFDTWNNDAQITINVEGDNLVARRYYEGAGTVSSRARWFSFGQIASTERKVTFDFKNVGSISIVPSANTSNIVFYGTDINVKNANVSWFTAEQGVNVDIAVGSHQTGNIRFENCTFSVLTSGNAAIASNGEFINCYGRLQSTNGNSLCFTPKSASLIRVIGGTYYAYIRVSGTNAAIFYTTSTETDATIIATNINCPTVAVAGYSQQYLSVANAGKTWIMGVSSTMTTQGANTEIIGQIWKSKGR